MKQINIILVAALFLLTLAESAEAFEEWNKTESLLFSAELAFATVDYFQTVNFPKYRLEEGNPVMRRFNDNRRQLAAFVVGIHLLEFGLLSGFPEMRMTLWPQVFIHAGVVFNNQRVIMQMKASF